MKQLFFVLFISLSSLSSAETTLKSNQQVYSINQKDSIEIFINKKGKIIVDGLKVSTKELDKTLKNLALKKGTVKFAKASMSLRKVKEATNEFNKLLKKHQVVVYTYTDNTFTKQIIQ